ncbi:MAG: hypothetical protein P4L22_01335 [Candidatus Babeliales bacterium]|nr:hypothetical protein [Candidatus Babeliales bacterium]
MKKNIMFILLLSLTSLANAFEAPEDVEMDIEEVEVSTDLSSPADLSSLIDKKIELIKFKKDEKKSWFDFKNKYKTKVIDLMKKHHDECFDLEISGMKEVKSKGFTPELIKAHILKALDLNEKQSKECEALYKEKMEEAMKIKDKNNAARAKLKASL